MARIVDANDLIGLLTDQAIAQLGALDTLVSKRTGGSNGNPQYVDFHKDWREGGAARPNTVINQWYSLWTLEGRPSAGATPGAFANPTNATAGAQQQANATGGRALRRFSFAGLSSLVGTLVVYDRLMHVSGLDGTVTTAQNLNGGSAAGVTRYTTGERNELWLEIYTALGATATTATATYSNQAGSAKTTQPVVIGGANRNEAGRIIKCSLASGDFGVRDATAVTVLASTLTAGNFGVTIARTLAMIPIGVANAGFATYFANGPFEQVAANACLAYAFITAGTAAPLFDGALELLEV